MMNDKMDKLVTVLVDKIKKESNLPRTVIAKVKTAPPNITLEFGGQTIQTGQIYVNNMLLSHYKREYSIDGTIDDITINTTTSNIIAANHTHKHGDISGTGTYKTSGDIWLEDTLTVGSEVLVELVGNLFVVVAQVVKMPNNAIEGA